MTTVTLTTASLFGALALFYPDPYEGGQVPPQPFLSIITSDNGDGTANLVTLSADGRLAARLNIPTFAAGATVSEQPAVYALAIAGGIALSTVSPLLVQAAIAAVAPNVPLAATLGAHTTVLEAPAVPAPIEVTPAAPAPAPAAPAPAPAPAPAAPVAPSPLEAASAILSPAAPAV